MARYIVVQSQLPALSGFFVVDTQSDEPGSGAGYTGAVLAQCTSPSRAVALAAALNA